MEKLIKFILNRKSHRYGLYNGLSGKMGKVMLIEFYVLWFAVRVLV